MTATPWLQSGERGGSPLVQTPIVTPSRYETVDDTTAGAAGDRQSHRRGDRGVVGTGCREDVLAANVDPTVSPGSDFYQYATGAWLKQHPLPDDQARWGIGNAASDEVYAQLRRISEAAAARTAPRGSAAQLIGDFFATGMDEATINRQALAPLQPEFDRIDRIASIDDVIDVVALLHKRTMLIDGFPRASPRG